MKTNRTLRALALGLALVSTSAGCRIFGDESSRPSIASVEPGEGGPGSTVTVILANFDDKRDTLLFGGVPVRADGANVSDPSTERAVRVPNLEDGRVSLTVRRGLYESGGVAFTILASATNEADPPSTDDIEPSDPGNTTGGTTTGGTTAGGTTGGTGETGGTTGSGETPPTQEPPPPEETPPTDDTPPEETPPTDNTPPADDTPPPPPPMPAALVELSEGSFNLSFNYVKLDWSVANVDAAFIRVPVKESYVNVIPFGQFQGNTYFPFPFGLPADEINLLDKLANSPLEQDFGSLPFNYCQVGAQGREIISHPCYDPNPNKTAYNYVDIMIPLAAEEISKSGTWKFRLPAKLNAFTIYFRDWSKNVSHKDVKILRPYD